VEFYTTHTHKNGLDQAYQYGYLFQETLKKPDNAKYLVLPKTNAFLVAATEYRENTLVKSNQYLIDQFDF
jgi:hypothetical protein